MGELILLLLAIDYTDQGVPGGVLKKRKEKKNHTVRRHNGSL